MRSLALLSAALLLAASPDSCGEQSLDSLLECHDAAVGGDALRAAQRLELNFAVGEAGTIRGRYRATREGQARIDLFSRGQRVFSTGWDGRQAWLLPDGAEQPEPRPEGEAVLRHGTEQPGRLWTLADMPRNGHKVRLDGREDVNGTNYYVVELTLADGTRSWHLVHPETCLIERQRSSDEEGGETLFEDFRTSQGITRAYRQRNVDRATGATTYQQQVLDFVLDPDWGSEAMSPGPGDPAVPPSALALPNDQLEP